MAKRKTRSERAADWLEKHTALPILGVAVLGAVIVGALFYFGGLWPAAKANPPWTLVSALLGGPAALLTWYWRTKHRKREIDTARSTELNTRFASAVELLAQGKSSALGAIYALEQLSRESETHYAPVIETLAAYVRRPRGDNFENESHGIQAAVTVLGRRDATRDPDGMVLDFSGATLQGISFRRGNFRGANFTGADLRRAKFYSARLEGSNFNKAIVDGAAFDEANLSQAKFMIESAIHREDGERFTYDNRTTLPTGKRSRELFLANGEGEDERETWTEGAQELVEEEAREAEAARKAERGRKRGVRVANEAAAEATKPETPDEIAEEEELEEIETVQNRDRTQ